LKRSLALVALVIVGVPITIVIGLLGVYFLFGGVGAFTTGILAATGAAQPRESPRSLLLMAPAMAAIGALASAGVAGYFWLIATMIRRLRRD
jgi:hypothetical protein